MGTRCLPVLVGGLLLAGCSQGSDLGSDFQRVQLPGFSVELPAGELVTTTDAPTSGKHEINLSSLGSRDGKLWVEWGTQSYTREDWKTLFLPSFLKAMGRTFDARTPTEEVLAENRFMFVVDDSRLTASMGLINCEPGFSVIVGFVGPRPFEAVTNSMRRMVSSVDCAVTDANRARLVVATRLPAKFGRAPDPEVQIYQSLDGEQLVINFTRSDVQRNQKIFQDLMRSMIGNVFGHEIPESRMTTLVPKDPRPAGKSTLIRIDLEQMPVPAYMGTLYCPRHDISVITIWFGAESSDQLARERQTQVDCPGTESTPTPAFEEIAAEACGAGAEEMYGLKQWPE